MMMKQRMLNWLKLACLVMAAGTALAQDPNAIKSIEVRNDSADRQEITIVMKNPAQVPASFVVNAPPRIAFDFVNTANDSGKTSVPVSGGNLKGVNIAESGGRTRVVFSLIKSVVYETRISGNKLMVTLNQAPSGQPVSSATAVFSATNTQRESIKEIDFRRGKNGEGRVLIDLSNPNVGIDVRQQGKNLVVEFSKTTLPRQFERRMDVVDFATPVQSIDTYSQGETVKMVIEPKGTWEYSAYQTENRFTVEVKNIDEQAKKLAELDKPTYKGDKLSFNFQNIEVRTVLQVIAEFTGKNIITSDTVTGNLTLRLKDVPWDQAMDLVLQSKGLDKRENGNVLWVAPRDEIAAREKMTLEAKRAIADIEPLRSETFQLNYQKAEDIKTMLMSSRGDDKSPTTFLSKNGTVIAEPRTNTLIVSEISSKLEEIRNLIARIDAPAKQVMIEGRIVIAKDDFGRTLGARLGLRGDRTIDGSTRVGIASGVNDSFAVINNGVDNGTTTQNVQLPSAGINGVVPASIGVTLLNRSVGALLSLELQALEAEGNGRTVSSPRLITGDQQRAVIRQGKKFYVNRATTDGVVSEEKEAVLMLEVTPRITPDRRVFLEIRVTNDSLQPGNVVDTRSIETKVLVPNGDTAVLGGIYEMEETTNKTQVPLLGNVPVVGNLFKTRAKAETKREILIFITPRILDDSLSLR